MAMSRRKQEAILLPFKNADIAEAQLKNLDIADSSDKTNQGLKVVRRNSSIQKDYFSVLEYLV